MEIDFKQRKNSAAMKTECTMTARLTIEIILWAGVTSGDAMK